MALEKKYEFLLARADRVLGNHCVKDAVIKVRAIVGPRNIPDNEPLAQSAIDKLRQAEKPTAQELTALEIIVRLLRPVVFSRNAQLDDLPESEGKDLYPQEYKDLWNDFRKKVEPLLYSIGRVEFVDGRHVGTGFLVGDGLLATNRHVLGDLTFGSEELSPGAARVVFKQEEGATNPPEHIIPLDSVAAIHPKLDMVLLRMQRLERPYLTIEAAPLTVGARVATIGYPAEDWANNPLFLLGVFQGRFGVKRAALGEVLDGTASPNLFHDCSTTQGNSGSPIFSLTTGFVGGIHRSGLFMYRNEAVDAGELKNFIQNSKS